MRLVYDGKEACQRVVAPVPAREIPMRILGLNFCARIPPYGITEDCQSAVYGAQETQLCVGKTQCSDCLVIKGDADKRNEIDHSNHKA